LSIRVHTLRASRADDGVLLVGLWHGSVDATHHFLSAEDRQEIDAEVGSFAGTDDGRSGRQGSAGGFHAD